MAKIYNINIILKPMCITQSDSTEVDNSFDHVNLDYNSKGVLAVRDPCCPVTSRRTTSEQSTISTSVQSYSQKETEDSMKFSMDPITNRNQ